MITFENVGYNYPKKPVFGNLSLTMTPGNIYGLLGENGTGKTTLINLITGTLIPQRGSITVMGNEAFWREKTNYQDLFVVPEEFELPRLTLQQFVKIYAPFYPKFSTGILGECVSRFRISFDDRLDRMSMGQRKKALIAFAIATRASLMIFDEPTNGLDIPSKSVFRALVAENSDPERLIIISTHQIRDIDSLLDRVAIVDNHDLLVDVSVAQIEEKLCFAGVSEIVDPIYCEGAMAIGINNGFCHTNINLELFFNAAVSNKKMMKQLF